MSRQGKIKSIFSTLLFSIFIIVGTGLHFVFADEIQIENNILKSVYTDNVYIEDYHLVKNKDDLELYIKSIVVKHDEIKKINIFKESVVFTVIDNKSGLLDIFSNNEEYLLEIRYDKQNSVKVISSYADNDLKRQLERVAKVPIGTEITPSTMSLLINSVLPVLVK